MYLQLAENGTSLSDRFKPQSIRYTPRSVRYGKERGAQSDSGYSYGSGKSPGSFYAGGGNTVSMSEPENPFIYVPDPTGLTGGMYVREDHFDHLNPSQWRQMMANLAPYQPSVQNGVLSEGRFLNDRAARKAKREERKEKRQEKRETRQEQKEEKKEAKIEKKKASAEAKIIKAKSGQRPGAEILGKVVEAAGKVGGDLFGIPQFGGVPETETPGGTEKGKSELSFFKRKTFGINNGILTGAAAITLIGGVWYVRNR